MAGDFSNSGHTLNYINMQTIGDEAVFGGSPAHIWAPDNADWHFGAGEFTIELFGVKFAVNTGVHHLLSQANTPSGYGWRIVYTDFSGTKMLRFGYSAAGTSFSHVDAAWTPTVGQAYDICAERSGNTFRMYLDGAMLFSGALSATLFNSAAQLRLGCWQTGGANADFFNGRMKAWRITKGTAKYANDAGYVVPTLPLPTS